MTVEETRAVVASYLAADDDDVSMMADDVVFRIMGSGVEYRGGQAIVGMFDLYYRTAFEATYELGASMIGEGWAVLEGTLIGRHIGTFDGVPATGRPVRIPLCVCYEFRNNRLAEGRVYFETRAFLEQVGARAGASDVPTQGA